MAYRQIDMTDADRMFSANLGYLREMVAEGMADESEIPYLCEPCSDLGIDRPAIFGEDFCKACWNGLWWGEEPRC